MRILVTNDDGIDSVGLHVLARSMRPFGDVVIVAPDQEYSGAGAGIGSLLQMRPEVHRTEVDGIDEAWAVTGAPALCAMFARLGAFGPVDLVVSGINPGANVGRSVYHSGTVGACLTARNGGINSVAVSQSVDNWGVEGQGWEEMLESQQWQGAADIAALMVGPLSRHLPADPVVLNINVPNLSAAEMKGWQRTRVATAPPRSMSTAELIPKPGHDGSFHVDMAWGDAIDSPITDDTGAVMAGYASITWLGRLEGTDVSHEGAPAAEASLDDFFS